MIGQDEVGDRKGGEGKDWKRVERRTREVSTGEEERERKEKERKSWKEI